MIPQTANSDLYLPTLVVILTVSIIVLWRRHLSRRVLVQRIAELEDLSRAGSAIVAAQLDFPKLCDFIVKEAGQIMNAPTFQLGFFEGHEYHIQSWMVDGQPREPRVFDLNEGTGLVGWVREHKCHLLVRDLYENDLPAKPRLYSQPPPRSAIFIPLIAGDEVLGIIAAQSQQVGYFNEKQVRQLSILANQAAAAIANGRLFEQERRRAAQIELLGAVTRQINAAENLEELFERVVTLTKETFGFFQVNIFARNPHQNALVLRASSASELSSLPIQFSLDEGLVGAAVLLRRDIVANDARQDNRFVVAIGIPEADQLLQQVRSVMVFPLVVNRDVWGVLEVLSTEINAFGPQEREVVSTLDTSVEIAIHKAQQTERQRLQAWLTTARLQVAQAVSRAAELEDVVANVTRLLPILLGAKQSGILLWEEVHRQYRGGAIYGVTAETARRFKALTLPSGRWGSLEAVHTSQLPLTTSHPPPWQPTQQAPLTLVPLISNARRHGVLFLQLSGPLGRKTRYTTGEVYPDVPDVMRLWRQELLQSMAEQTAQAIERARLRQAQREEAWVNTALLQVADAVNSLIDLNEILSTIVRFAPLLVGVDSVVVLTYDLQSETLHPGPSYGLSEMGEGVLRTLELTLPELRTLSVRQEQPEAPRTTVQHYTLQSPPWLKQVLNTSEARAIPLRAQGQFVGVMLVGLHSDDYQLNGRRLNILSGIAQQAATAVVNNRLYAEAAERDKLERELEVARHIQTSLMPAGNPCIPHCSVASYWQAARQVSGDFYDFIQLRDGRWVILIADVADKGMPAALFMAVSRTILRTVANSRTDPAAVLQRTNELLLQDSDSDLFVTVFIALWNPDTHQLHYASGGHNPPLLFHTDGRYSLLKATGMALGILEAAQFETREVQLLAGEVVLLYTDGVTEAINEDFDEFGPRTPVLDSHSSARTGSSRHCGGHYGGRAGACRGNSPI